MTPRQFRKLKQLYPNQDDNIILIASLYVQKQLDVTVINTDVIAMLDQVLSSTLAGKTLDPAAEAARDDNAMARRDEIPDDARDDRQEIINETKNIIKKFSETISPIIQQLQFTIITHSEASELAAKLLAASTYHLSTSNDELCLPESVNLLGITALFSVALNEAKQANPEQIIQILDNLFTQFPETRFINAFNDLHLQAHLLQASREEENTLFSFAKEALSLQKKIEMSYLTAALTSFEQWKKYRRSYGGALCQITQLTDKLARQYPQAKNNIIRFFYYMLCDEFINTASFLKYYAKFLEIVNALIAIDDEKIVQTICSGLGDSTATFSAWTLITVFDHHVFVQFNPHERKIILKLIATMLDNETPCTQDELRRILNKCKNPTIRPALLQRLNEFYQRLPFPPLAEFLSWVEEAPSNQVGQFANTLAEHYVAFHIQPNGENPVYTKLAKQLSKFEKDLITYANTSFLHTRKLRAAYLKELNHKTLEAINLKENITAKEVQEAKLKILTELYLHYATIENASGLLSRSLEKRLIKLLDIPKYDPTLIAAKNKRESFSYKLNNFFHAGRGCFKSHFDKAKDPVHAIIQKKLPASIKSQIKHLRTEILQLDQQDRAETSLFSASLIPNERMEGISEKIAKTIK